MLCFLLVYLSRPVARKGCEGVHLNLPFGLQKVLYTVYTLLSNTFQVPYVCKWSTSLAAIEIHHCPNEFGCSYAPCGTPTYVSGLHCCDERMCINACTNKSPFQTVILLVDQCQQCCSACKPWYLLLWKFNITWLGKHT